jgi:xanthine dehydrogenase accessory factor
VESDVVRRGRDVLETGRPVLAHYSLATDAELELGLGCGSIDVLIEPFDADASWRELARALEERQEATLAVGLTPEGLMGRRLVALSDGRHFGTIDPAADPGILREAAKMREAGQTGSVTIETAAGTSTVFIETFLPVERLFIVGATEIGAFLCRFAHEVGFEVIVVDPRSAFATTERFPDARELRHGWPEEVLEKTGLDGRAYVVTLTHDSKLDVPALAAALRSEARYIGALGSRRTHARRAAQLTEGGFDEPSLARIHAPVGLDIGAATPAEIAVAILAEMLAVRNAHDATTTRDRRSIPRAGTAH